MELRRNEERTRIIRDGLSLFRSECIYKSSDIDLIASTRVSFSDSTIYRVKEYDRARFHASTSAS